MSKLSVVISAFNEENNIEACLKSALFADEIVLINNSSTDKTEEMARKYTKNIYTQKNNPSDVDLQKNFGFSKATGDWILSLDADEEVSKELAEEIKSKIQNPKSEISGYWLPRKNIIFGKFIEHTGWYPDYQLRLFRKGRGRYVNKHVHEDLSVDGETINLKKHLIHHNYNTISDFINKTVNIYAVNEAEEKLRMGYSFSYFDAIRFPLSEFLSRFFARKGYKDGFHGLMLSMLMAFYHLIVFAFIWEKQGFKKYEGKEFLDDTEKEFKRAGKEIFFWISKEKMEAVKNPIKKNLYRISRKIRL
ncbi:MAG: glycosyltransferase family 2 protein [Patescibacteria group bacterium]|nr:glycosyltransferase family 2 protein [Patescibacteria group bacterium]